MAGGATNLRNRVHWVVVSDTIEGAERVLERIKSVRMEVALREAYSGEMVFHEAIPMMKARGYILVDAWVAWTAPHTGEVMHFDMLFKRMKKT